MRNTKAESHSHQNHASSKHTPSASMGMISIQAHAAALRRKTEVRRKLEDLRLAEQAARHPYQDKD
jgi:hypothetical protein